MYGIKFRENVGGHTLHSDGLCESVEKLQPLHPESGLDWSLSWRAFRSKSTWALVLGRGIAPEDSVACFKVIFLETFFILTLPGRVILPLQVAPQCNPVLYDCCDCSAATHNQFVDSMDGSTLRLPLSMQFSREKTGVGCQYFLQGIILTPGIGPESSALVCTAGGLYLLSHWEIGKQKTKQK